MSLWDSFDAPQPEEEKPDFIGGIRGLIGDLSRGVVNTGKNLITAGGSFAANDVRKKITDRTLDEQKRLLTERDAGRLSQEDAGRQISGLNQALMDSNRQTQKPISDFQAIDPVKAAADAADAVLTVGTLGLGGLAKTGVKAGIQGLIRGGTKSTLGRAVGRGAGEGAAFGTGYGTLKPLQDRGGEATGDEIANSAIGGGLLGGALGGGVGGALNIGGKVINAGKRVSNKLQSVFPEVPGSQGVLSRVAASEPLQDRAASSLLKLTPAQAQKFLDSGVDTTRLAQRASQFGGSADEIIGATGKNGPLQDTIRVLEEGIQTTAKAGGTNIKIDASDIIRGLEKEAKTIRRELGGGARSAQIQKVIADAKAKYKNGVSVSEALKTLRTANAKFGKAIVDDSGDAIITAAQKLEANSLRDALKGRFPTIAQGLDDQSELIQLREILQKTRAKDKVGGFNTGKLDLTRPGTLVDPILNSKAVSTGILKRAKGEPVASPEVADAFGAPKAAPISGVINAAQGSGVLGRVTRQGAAREAVDITQPVEEAPAQAEYTGEGYVPPVEEQSNAPFSKDNIQTLIARDLAANDGKNVTTLLKLYETFGADTKEKPLSAEASKVLANANSGLDSLAQLEGIISESGVPTATVIPGRDLFGGAGANVLGTANYDTIARNIADVITRLRTGAALTEQEEAFYKDQLPKAFDNPETIATKMKTFKDLFSSIANRTGTAGTDTQSALGL